MEDTNWNRGHYYGLNYPIRGMKLARLVIFKYFTKYCYGFNYPIRGMKLARLVVFNLNA